MRAARVLDMLLVLQRRGRLTARELSAALEVSERTILRDVEALSEAGVPIYTSRGTGGGIELMDGFETRLTGLTPEEARCLFLIGQPQVAHRLGLAVAARAAEHKLSGSLPAELADQAETLPGWFLHDPDPWGGNPLPHGELRRIASSIRRRRRVELHLADQPAITVEPLGLVLKAGSWCLIQRAAPGARSQQASDPERQAVSVICLDTLRATRLTTKPFDAPHGFSLAAFWAAHVVRENAAR